MNIAYLVIMISILMATLIVVSVLVRIEDSLDEILHEQHRLRGGEKDFDLYDIWYAIDQLDEHLMDMKIDASIDIYQEEDDEVSGDPEISE